MRAKIRLAPTPRLVFAVTVAVGLIACGSAPTPTAPVPLPEPRVVEAGAPAENEQAGTKEAGAPSDAGTPNDASPSSPARDAMGDASTALRGGPVTSESDAVERAARVANAALDKAYALHVKKAQVAPTHTGAWTRDSPRQVRGTPQTGWEVTFASHPPAGFEHEAVVHVSPQGILTVKKATATFSSD